MCQKIFSLTSLCLNSTSVNYLQSEDLDKLNCTYKIEMIEFNLWFFASFFLILCCCHTLYFLFAFYKSAKFLVLKAVLIKIQVIWDMTLCRFVNIVEPQFQIHLVIKNFVPYIKKNHKYWLCENYTAYQYGNTSHCKYKPNNVFSSVHFVFIFLHYFVGDKITLTKLQL